MVIPWYNGPQHMSNYIYHVEACMGHVNAPSLADAACIIDTVCRSIPLPLSGPLSQSQMARPISTDRECEFTYESSDAERKHTGRLWVRGEFKRKYEQDDPECLISCHSWANMWHSHSRSAHKIQRRWARKEYFEWENNEKIWDNYHKDWVRDVFCALRQEGVLVTSIPKDWDVDWSQVF